jgi:hypothetical protein
MVRLKDTCIDGPAEAGHYVRPLGYVVSAFRRTED